MAQEINISSTSTQYDERRKKADEIRNKYGDNTIVLFEVGDFYETYGEGAQQMAKAIGVTLRMVDRVKNAAFPVKAEHTYFPRLVREGFKLCIMTKGNY